MKQYHLQNKPDREITSKKEIAGILENGKYAVISMCRDNEPYIVTLSYGYDPESNSLYFHAAKKGLKLDFILVNSNVCGTVIEDGGYIIDECEHNFQTVVFWGKMSVLDNIDEKKQGMRVLLNHLEKKQTVIADKLLKADDSYSKMAVLRLDITQIHGKAGK